jgi:hypothetical protein
MELEKIVVEAKMTLVADLPSRLAFQHLLTGAHRADRPVKKAVELLDVVVKGSETLAEDHPSRLASQHALAMAYQADGQVHKAVALLQHVVAVDARTLRENHPSRLASVKALADMLAELAIDSDEASSVSCESSPVS